MTKRIAISQSNYIPWKGFFDFINSVDEFVLYDDMQYTRRDWRNRNKIKTSVGSQWLTIPVQVKGKYHQKINETLISDPGWGRTHWEHLKHAYSRAPYFDAYAEIIENLYEQSSSECLSEINRTWIEAICRLLNIDTRLRWSSDYHLEEDRNERLISICQQAGATEYYSGPAAQSYMDLAAFAQAGIGVHWMDYSGYPPYPQLHGSFDPFVSILDLLFNVGSDATLYMKSFACVSRS